MFKKLNPLLHSELRLAVMSLLINCEEADFVYLREATGTTAGNLSVQIDKLSTAGYIEVEKHFRGKKPHTICRITSTGFKAFEEYVEALKTYFGK
ncbi:MAG: transcriptional regulator [Bacteroidaceae bacterium]|jgi:DNA-binding MarR family transcriptional regulator|nr:transcriptional regulator [Bacteroidaceae bacterium]